LFFLVGIILLSRVDVERGRLQAVEEKNIALPRGA
jgi:hypothetical protein